MLTRHQYETMRTILAVGGSRPLVLTMGRTNSFGRWRPGQRKPGALRRSTVNAMMDAGLVEWTYSYPGTLYRRAPSQPSRELVLFATAAGCKAFNEYETHHPEEES